MRRGMISMFLIGGMLARGSSPTAPAWDGQVQVTGSVRDFAVLTIGGPNPFATTDQSGWFQQSYGCGLRCAGFNTYFLTITHPGYRDLLAESSRGVCFVVRRDYELVPQ